MYDQQLYQEAAYEGADLSQPKNNNHTDVVICILFVVIVLVVAAYDAKLRALKNKNYDNLGNKIK